MPSRANYEAVLDFQFREDSRFWVESDRRIALRILDLVEAIIRDLFQGIGKPEPLKYVFAGCWSRRSSPVQSNVLRLPQNSFV